MSERMKVSFATAATLISTTAAVLKILEWFGYTHANLPTWPNWLQALLTVIIFAVSIGGTTLLVRWWLAKDRQKRADGKTAFANYVLATLFAERAKELQNQLEETWHDWNTAGDAFTYPFLQVSKFIPERPELQFAAQDFRVRYNYYFEFLSQAIPDVVPSLKDGNLNALVYIDTKRMIGQHIDVLESFALFNEKKHGR